MTHANMKVVFLTIMNNKSKDTYIPISCTFYDELEALATLGKTSLISYRNEQGETEEAIGRIKDLYSKDKVEFMLLENGLRIRLDTLISVNKKVLPRSC